MIGLSSTQVKSYGETEDISYDQVASDSEKAAVQEVGIEGMTPIYGTDVADGVYDVEVESSSSMFRIEKAKLTVSEGKMTADLTLSGTGYLKLFMGTGTEAATSDISSYIGYETDGEGKYVYTVPVEALDMPIDCAAFSLRKEKWYDRSILFEAASLPEGAVLVELPDYDALEEAAREKRIEAMKTQAEESPEASPEEETASAALIEMEDGEYAIEVVLEGGSGRATVNSPADLIIRDGRAYARIEWSSSNYDYMIVGGEKYLPVHTEGNSMFEIPILIFDKAMSVIADTTAMSTPHEVEYTLTFYSDSIMSQDETPQAQAQRVVYMVIVIIAVCIIVPLISKKRRNRIP